MPALGQVQGEVAAAVPGSARSHADQVAPDRGAAGLAVGEAGLGAGGAQQVAADRGQRELGRVGREAARQVGQRAVGPVGEDLLGLGMAAVLLLGLQHGERRVGEDRVVPPGGDQLALAGGGVAVEVP